MRVTVPGIITVEQTRGKVRAGVVALAAVVLASGLIGYAVVRQRHAFSDAQRGGERTGANTPRTVTLKAGDDLQRALEEARPGDTLVLQAGATFAGPMTLPRKRGDDFINVRSSALERLPPEGQRVSPADSASMPKVVSPGRGESALRTAPGAHHYRFVGVEFATKDEDALAYELLKLGGDDAAQDTLEEVPHHLVFDRCYIHAYASQSLKRGIALNSAETSIINSYVAGFKVVGQEAQAVAGWNGPGPFHIVNNYLEGAGENLMFGGARAAIPGLVPTDIEVRRNHFAKDPAWFTQYTSYAGTHWTVKNLFELKNARRVIIDGNLFEYNWTDAQSGYAVIFTPRPNDSGAAAVVEDVQFTNNVVRHVPAVFQIAGQDDLGPNPKAHLARRISIINNLFDDVDGERWSGDGAFLKIGHSADSVTVDHNTIIHTGNITKAYGDPSAGFVFTNNLLTHNAYGIFGDNQSPGQKTIETYFPGIVFRGNVIAGAEARLYPPGNLYPPTLGAARFVDAAAGDYRLQTASPFHARATDGKDVGCDFAALEAASATASTRPRTVSGRP
jgi:hypothetical protein